MLIHLEKHPLLVQAYKDYMQAIQMKRNGLITNTSYQAAKLRGVYHMLKGS